MRCWWFAASACAVIALAGPAYAEPDELAAARTRFREGLALETAGQPAAALAKFQEVARVRLTPQVRFHIGRCEEALGRWSAALGEYRLAAAETATLPADEAAEVRDAVDPAIAALEAKIPTVRIRVRDAAPRDEVELDGVVLGNVALAAPIKIDPGMHAVIRRVAGQLVDEQRLTVATGEHPEIELKSVPKEKDAAPKATPTRGGSVPTIAWVLGAIGAGSLGGSGVFYGLRAGTISDLDARCQPTCAGSDRSLADRGETYTTVGNVMLVSGAALLVTAGVIAIVGLSRSSERP